MEWLLITITMDQHQLLLLHNSDSMNTNWTIISTIAAAGTFTIQII